MNEVLESTQYVVQQSRHVRIDANALDRFIPEMLLHSERIPPWDCHYHFCDDLEATAAYLLVLDTLNFCFWPLPGNPRWEFVWKAERISGYVGLAAALKKAVLSHVPITDPNYLADMTVEQLENVLGGHGTLPLIIKRVQNLKELGSVLCSEFGGKIVRLIEAADGSAVALARLLAQKLISFRDVASFKSRQIFFYKRAQIFASDLCSAFNGRKWGSFHDVHRLTAFADYKLPQVLRHIGVLLYSKELSERVDKQDLLSAGSEEEVEIRAATIWAVEQIRRALDEKGKRLKASHIDWVLWTLGQKDTYRAKPYHRTLTIFY